jgi:hypothetical protein
MYYSVRQTFTCVVASVLWYTKQVGCFYLYAYSEWVSVMSVIQHSKRMHRVILSSVACRAPLFFPHYLINGTIIGKKSYWTSNVCVFIFSKTFFWYLSHSKKNWARHRFSCKASVIFVRFYWNLNFLDRFPKSTQINFTKIRSVAAEFFHVERRTDGRTFIRKLLVACRSFVNASINGRVSNQLTN